MFSVCLCARFQSFSKESHLIAVNALLDILRALLEWAYGIRKSKQFPMTSYSDAVYAGCRVDRKSTSGTCQFLENCLVSWSPRNKNSVPFQPLRRSMLRLELVVHKSYG